MSLLGFLRRHYRDLPRVRQIIMVASRHGFGHFVEQIGLQRFVSFSRRLFLFKKQPPPEHRMRAPERLRLMFEELGPSFIKLGQVLACRPDMLPVEYAQELCKLTDSVPPFPFAEAKAVIEKELGAPLAQIFATFDPVPVAAASIAQAHRATLIDGREVMVKVQRPHIERIITRDVSILGGIAELIEVYAPEMAVYNPRGIVEEFARTIGKELDFFIEASNAIRLRNNFEGSDILYVPEVFSDYSSKHVLVLGRVEGFRIDDIEEISRMGFDPRELSRKGAAAYFQMVLRDGFFHADPHPGNIFVLADGRLGLVDFGIMGRVTEENMEQFANVFLALAKHDYNALVRAYIKLGFVSEEMADIDKFRRDMREELAELLEPYYGMKVRQIDFGSYVERVTSILIRYHLKQPQNLYLVNKTLLTLEGLLKQIDPEFDYFEAAKPYVARLIRKRKDPRAAIRNAWKNVADVQDILTTMPKQISTFFRKLLRDDIHINLRHEEINRLIRDVDKSSNRLSFSILTAAIIVASSIVIHSDLGSKLFGFPVFGLIGYLIAAVLGFWLLIGILRSGQL